MTQVNEIKGQQRKDIRDYLRDNLSARNFDNLPAILNTSKHRVTKMLNYVESHPWTFDILVALFRVIDSETIPSEFIKDCGLIHELTELQIEALDQLLDD